MTLCLSSLRVLTENIYIYIHIYIYIYIFIYICLVVLLCYLIEKKGSLLDLGQRRKATAPYQEIWTGIFYKEALCFASPLVFLNYLQK